MAAGHVSYVDLWVAQTVENKKSTRNQFSY